MSAVSGEVGKSVREEREPSPRVAARRVASAGAIRNVGPRIERTVGHHDSSGTATLRGAVFLDRDGTINDGSEYYVLDYAEFHFLPGALDAIRQLSQAGYPPIVVSNQSCVAKGLATMQQIEDIHRRMRADVEATSGQLLDVLFCPHWENDACTCRKPQPGMFFTAAKQHDIDLPRSIYVGDRELDLMAARAAGCKFVLVGNEPLSGDAGQPEHRAPSLLAAVPWILAQLSA